MKLMHPFTVFLGDYEGLLILGTMTDFQTKLFKLEELMIKIQLLSKI